MEPITDESQYFSKKSSREIQSKPRPESCDCSSNAKKLTEVDLSGLPADPWNRLYKSHI